MHIRSIIEGQILSLDDPLRIRSVKDRSVAAFADRSKRLSANVTRMDKGAPLIGALQ